MEVENACNEAQLCVPATRIRAVHKSVKLSLGAFGFATSSFHANHDALKTAASVRSIRKAFASSVKKYGQAKKRKATEESMSVATSRAAKKSRKEVWGKNAEREGANRAQSAQN